MPKEISQKVLRQTEFFELYLQEIRGYAQTILLLVPLTDKAVYS